MATGNAVSLSRRDGPRPATLRRLYVVEQWSTADLQARYRVGAWLADEHQWIFDSLPGEISVVNGQGSIGPALSIRAHRQNRRFARYDSVSRTAITGSSH